jgi:hypothetical protein
MERLTVSMRQAMAELDTQEAELSEVNRTHPCMIQRPKSTRMVGSDLLLVIIGLRMYNGANCGARPRFIGR